MSSSRTHAGPRLDEALTLLREVTEYSAVLGRTFFLFRRKADLVAARAVQAAVYQMLVLLGYKDAADDALEGMHRDARGGMSRLAYHFQNGRMLRDLR